MSSRYLCSVTESTAELLLGTARRLRRAMGAAMTEWGITPGRARALRLVVEQGPVRLSELALQLRIAPRSATEVVEALVEAGLVGRITDPADRRATLVEATALGRRTATEVGVVRDRASAEFLAPLTPTDRETLARILGRLDEEEACGSD